MSGFIITWREWPIYSITPLRWCGVMLVVLLLSACTGLEKNTSQTDALQEQDKTRPLFTTCPNTRPQICTQEYAPVCARRDSGIRCVKAPCPATEMKTYSNGCSACADPKVYGYYKGDCKQGLQQE